MRQGASLSLASLFSAGCRWQCGWLTFRLDKSTPHSSRNFSDADRPPPPPHFPPPCCSVFPAPCPSCANEHIKAIWSHSSWAPVSFLSSPLPGTLILIACFFAVAFFSNLKGPEPFLGLCARRRPCLKMWGGARGSRGTDEVSDVILGRAVQACDAAPLPAQSNQTVFVICVLLEKEEEEDREMQTT